MVKMITWAFHVKQEVPKVRGSKTCARHLWKRVWKVPENHVSRVNPSHERGIG